MQGQKFNPVKKLTATLHHCRWLLHHTQATHSCCARGL